MLRAAETLDGLWRASESRRRRETTCGVRQRRWADLLRASESRRGSETSWGGDAGRILPSVGKSPELRDELWRASESR